MTKNLTTRLNSKAASALIAAVLSFGMTTRPGVLPAEAKSDQAVNKVQSLERNQLEEIRTWVMGKYRSARFAYRIAMQVRDMQTKENATEAPRTGHFDEKPDGFLARLDCSRFGLALTREWKN